MKTIRSLRPYQWLYDEVITMFFKLLMRRDLGMFLSNEQHKRSYFFNSFFFITLLGNNGTYCYDRVKNHGKKSPGRDIFKLKYLFVIIHYSGCHWSLIVARMDKKKVMYYDSKAYDGSRFMDLFFLYLKDEHQQVIGEPFNNEEWEWVHYPSDCPSQGQNNNACGVMISAIGDLLLQDLPLNFRLSDVPYYRRRMTLSILDQEHPFSPVVPIS